MITWKYVALLSSVLSASVMAAALCRAAPSSPSDEEERHYAERGVDMMMDGDLNGAIALFQQIEQKDPASPLGFVLEADAVWWKIYLASANLVDPDVFDVANTEATPYDAHFDDLESIAIHKAEARIHNQQELARSNLYEGFAYALRARLEGLHDRDLATARAGKKMRTHLMKALELDPTLFDADLGIGIYNYFVDTLPAIVKFLSMFIMLPGGSRSEGLQQLQTCAEKGQLANNEAQFYLGKDYSRFSEQHYDKSLLYFSGLKREFPHNPLWPLLVGSVQYRMGKPQQGDAMYRQVYQMTLGKNSEVDQAVHRAVIQALQRQHAGEKFE